MTTEHSQLQGVIGRLRAHKSISEPAIDEIERVLQILQNNGWSGFIPADEALRASIAKRSKAGTSKQTKILREIGAQCSEGHFLRWHVGFDSKGEKHDSLRIWSKCYCVPGIAREALAK